MAEAPITVIGAGPAGLAAALAAREAGAEVLLLDENSAPGGQIWRATVGHKPYPAASRIFKKVQRCGAETWYSATVIDASEPGVIVVEFEGAVRSVPYSKLILATGARELFLPFPGWTLPGVMGAGGAQALLKGGANFEGLRVVVSGSGPLLLAVGAAFANAEADLIGVYEQTSWHKLVSFGLGAKSPSKALEGLRYLSDLGPAPYRSGTWVVEARGDGRLEEVVLTDGKWTWTEPCDLLACAYGLVPNIELAMLLGCAVTDGAVVANERQETNVPGVFAAGEPLGIGGLDLALAEGEVAGASAAGATSRMAKLQVTHMRSLRNLLSEAFALRPEVLALSKPGTILCRCEDVPMGAIAPHWSAREAKLYTRIGMGPCQGRVCGAAARCLFGWGQERPRPPLYPTEVGHLVRAEARAASEE